MATAIMGEAVTPLANTTTLFASATPTTATTTSAVLHLEAPRVS